MPASLSPGILEIGKIREGDTVLVSGAAGAVGAAVGQIAKIKGCRVIGIAGGEDKCRYITDELGFDGAIDYKSESLHRAVGELCAKGIDVYFDNVGGETLDVAPAQLRLNARVVLCGAISQYNNTGPIKGPENYLSLLINRATMQGFIVFDFATDYAQAAREMSQWMADGRLQAVSTLSKDWKPFPKLC